jgi:hypothetical protein
MKYHRSLFNKTFVKLLLVLLLSNSVCFSCFAQVDTISVKNNNLQTKYIVESASTYLNWAKDAKSGLVSSISISKRKVHLQTLGGKDVIVVLQHKLNNDSSKLKFIYTVSDRQTFETMYDYVQSADGVEAYDYRGGEIIGSDTVKSNTKGGFNLKFHEIPYCLELDLETVSALPIKDIGQKMAVCFYQPGREKLPKFQLIKVTGQEQLPTTNGKTSDCWVLKLTIDSEDYDLFWISKRKHEFLKLESHSPTDTFYKVKLFNQNLQM